MRVRALMLTLVIPAFGAGITACGGAAASRRVPTVRLELRSPADGTRVTSSSITVSGTVSPARATVLVTGRPAPVKPDGSFTARVSLSAGVNLIDVLASLPHAAGATSALRVERYVLVSVPRIVGDSPTDAEAALQAAGLVPRRVSADNPISSLLPLPEEVCAVSPQPGTQVSPGTTVTITTSKFCTGGLTSNAPEAPPAQAATPAVSGNLGNSGNAQGPGKGRGPDGTGPPGHQPGGHPGHGHGPQGDQGNGNGD